VLTFLIGAEGDKKVNVIWNLSSGSFAKLSVKPTLQHYGVFVKQSLNSLKPKKMWISFDFDCAFVFSVWAQIRKA
jgi:hypothetical protein